MPADPRRPTDAALKPERRGRDDEVVDAAGSPAAEQVHPAEARTHA